MMYLKAKGLDTVQEVAKYKTTYEGAKAYEQIWGRGHDPSVSSTLEMHYKHEADAIYEQHYRAYRRAGASKDKATLLAEAYCISELIVPPTYRSYGECQHCGPIPLKIHTDQLLLSCPWCKYI